jgi:Cu(I)/Ag(I) efflux system membrane fusion protein
MRSDERTGRAGLVIVAIACAALAMLAVVGIRYSRGGQPEDAASSTGNDAARLVTLDGGAEVLEFRNTVPGLTVLPVRRVDLPGTLEATGQVALDDRRSATIISRVTGRVEDTFVSQWDDVQPGQRIVSLYSPDYMTAVAEYLQAQATARVSGGSGLAEQSVLSQAIVAAARRKLQLLGIENADIEHLSAATTTLLMRAPIGGTVVQKEVVKGSQVNPGDVLFSLGVTDAVWITADIYESDLSRVQEGQPLEAVALAFPDQVFKGTVDRVSPNLDAASHTMQIRCHVQNPAGRLKPQMLARVRIFTSPGGALVVPQEAVVFETDAYFVFVEVAPHRFARRPVTLASWNEQGYARIMSGVEDGERVLGGMAIFANALWHQAHGESS